jgi:hypothetical protein
VNADVGLPDTVWKGESLTVDQTQGYWKPPVKALGSNANSEIEILWRKVGDLSWEPLGEKGVEFWPYDAGKYSLEIAAREDGYWLDQTPLEVVVHYSPDTRTIIEILCQQLESRDRDTRSAALARIKQLGWELEPALSEQIDEIEKAVSRLQTLRSIQRSVRQLPKRK